LYVSSQFLPSDEAVEQLCLINSLDFRMEVYPGVRRKLFSAQFNFWKAGHQFQIIFPFISIDMKKD
jgi:hypothetical protein